jgi:ferric-dicitrate binding protein FerR (iron transport regulator)
VPPKEYLQISGAGERKSFTLSDGTKVMLNAGSTLRIAREFNVSRREIWLEGEGFFEVTHDAGRPFVIHTSSMDVKVLGTVLNIRDYPSDRVTETSLLKGSVAVVIKGNDNKEIVLHPNEKIVVSNERSSVTSLLSSRTPAPGTQKKIKIAGLTYNAADSSLAEVSWTQNVLSFNETNFEEIAVQLERWYSVSIRFGDEPVKQFKFTGTFQKKTLPQVLDALQLSRHFEYEIKDDSLVVIKAQ